MTRETTTIVDAVLFAFLLIDHTRTFRSSLLIAIYGWRAAWSPILDSGDCGGKKLCQSVLLLEQVAELLSFNVSNLTSRIPYPLKQVVVRLFELMHHFLRLSREILTDIRGLTFGRRGCVGAAWSPPCACLMVASVIPL